MLHKGQVEALMSLIRGIALLKDVDGGGQEDFAVGSAGFCYVHSCPDHFSAADNLQSFGVWILRPRPGPSPRRLSEGDESSRGDSTLSRLIEQCVAMGEDFGLSVLQEGTSYDALDAAEHVARIAFALSQEALAFESED
ncbi:hypothetical protein EPH_0058480 [Eimeria praecox]|uniref:Uncharacterized protein n=1 Tax=Eimeria praecox TaxID=51316 RepID=U6H8R1_9EIME|nr:hypothetical protein EPH_0058480 [Eimeria praecox]